MSMKRLSMRKIKEVLRLSCELGLTSREIGRSLSISHPTVLDYLSRAKKLGLAWPLPDHLDDAALEKLFCGPSSVSTPSTRPLPDCAFRKMSIVLRHEPLEFSVATHCYFALNPVY